MEINEKEKVYDGLNIYSKQEYIDVIYPQLKEKARQIHAWLKTTKGGLAFSAESDMDHRYKLERGLWYNQKEYIECGDLETWF